MNSDNELMNVLVERASDLELEISRLISQRNVLHIIIDTIIEQDEGIISVYYC